MAVPEDITDELYIRRLTIDEAIFRLERYIHDAFMADIRRVRIVHGRGTGILRDAVGECLKRHSLVDSYRVGQYGEGGIGVTIAFLAAR